MFLSFVLCMIHILRIPNYPGKVGLPLKIWKYLIGFLSSYIWIPKKEFKRKIKWNFVKYRVEETENMKRRLDVDRTDRTPLEDDLTIFMQQFLQQSTKRNELHQLLFNCAEMQLKCSDLRSFAPLAALTSPCTLLQ